MLVGLAVTASLIVVLLVAVAVGVRMMPTDPANWHVDLKTTERPTTPNEFLAATPDYAATELQLEPPSDPVRFLEAVDRVAMSEARTARLAGAVGEGRITYVQRSAVFAFPDYVTIEAAPGRAAIWSRSRYGRSDLGVNGERVRRWVAAIR